MRRFRVTYAARSSLWLIPVLCILGGAGLAAITIAIDRGADDDLIPQSVTGSATDVQTILSTIATAMISLTSIVLTVTLVTVQLAMGQFSPRIVRALLDDRGDQVSIAVFAATFTFAIFSLRGVETGVPGAVPGVTVITAFALVTASSIALFLYVQHTSTRLRVGGLIELVGNDLRRELDGRFTHATVRVDDPSVVT